MIGRVRILLVTDAWEPQVNGVVRTLKTTARELTSMGHEIRFLTPLEFRTLPCPTYPEIRLSLFPQGQVNRTIREFDPDALHIATEGAVGMAGRAPPPRPRLPPTPPPTPPATVPPGARADSPGAEHRVRAGRADPAG